MYNVAKIAQASMVKDSIISTDQYQYPYQDQSLALGASGKRSSLPLPSLAEKLRIVVKPEKSNIQFEILLKTTDREQQQVNANTFVAMERTAQIITPLATGEKQASLRKDIETITSYRLVDANTIIALQRTATFLSPDDPRFALAYSRERRVASEAVDIRQYSVKYTKI